MAEPQEKLAESLGAFRNTGEVRIADQIIRTMKKAGYTVRESDPFADRLPLTLAREASPYVNRIRLMWAQMRSGRVPGAARLAPQAGGLPQGGR